MTAVSWASVAMADASCCRRSCTRCLYLKCDLQIYGGCAACAAYIGIRYLILCNTCNDTVICVLTIWVLNPGRSGCEIVNTVIINSSTRSTNRMYRALQRFFLRVLSCRCTEHVLSKFWRRGEVGAILMVQEEALAKCLC
jgi:hypothetical protein